MHLRYFSSLLSTARYYVYKDSRDRYRLWFSPKETMPGPWAIFSKRGTKSWSLHRNDAHSARTLGYAALSSSMLSSSPFVARISTDRSTLKKFVQILWFVQICLCHVTVFCWAVFHVRPCQRCEHAVDQFFFLKQRSVSVAWRRIEGSAFYRRCTRHSDVSVLS